MVTYAKICTVILQDKIHTFGQERVEEMAKNAGLSMTRDGLVEKADKTNLEQLILEFKKHSGQVGVIMARSAIRKLIKNETIDLPDILK